MQQDKKEYDGRSKVEMERLSTVLGVTLVLIGIALIVIPIVLKFFPKIDVEKIP